MRLRGERSRSNTLITEGAWVPLAAGAHRVSKAGENGMKVFLHARKPIATVKDLHVSECTSDR